MTDKKARSSSGGRVDVKPILWQLWDEEEWEGLKPRLWKISGPVCVNEWWTRKGFEDSGLSRWAGLLLCSNL